MKVKQSYYIPISILLISIICLIIFKSSISHVEHFILLNNTTLTQVNNQKNYEEISGLETISFIKRKISSPTIAPSSLPTYDNTKYAPEKLRMDYISDNSNNSLNVINTTNTNDKNPNNQNLSDMYNKAVDFFAPSPSSMN
jgi:hypothetical protein